MYKTSKHSTDRRPRGCSLIVFQLAPNRSNNRATYLHTIAWQQWTLLYASSCKSLQRLQTRGNKVVLYSVVANFWWYNFLSCVTYGHLVFLRPFPAAGHKATAYFIALSFHSASRWGIRECESYSFIAMFCFSFFSDSEEAGLREYCSFIAIFFQFSLPVANELQCCLK